MAKNGTDDRVVSTNEAGFRLVAALLLRHREISIAAIEALPFVLDRQGAEHLADELTRRLGAVRYQKQLAGPGHISRWEDVMCLTD